MDVGHPIDAEIRDWLKRHVENRAELSVAIGHSTSWLQKYVNGDGHATIDDLVRLAGLLMGLNLPALSDLERRLLRACQGMDEPDLVDVIAYAAHRAKLARNGPSKESSGTVIGTPAVKAHKGRGRR